MFLRVRWCSLLLLALLSLPSLAAPLPVPDRLIVLTFDDAVKSHRTFVAPLLKELGFGATFFVTHKWMEDQTNFLTWAEIGELHGMGFEVGNHIWTHADFSQPKIVARMAGELYLVDRALEGVKVPRPISFGYCGNSFGPEAVAKLTELGYRFARRGGQPEARYGTLDIGATYDPKAHHPLLIPTTGDSYPGWTFAHFTNVVARATNGQIVVLQFHGVPDVAHPWVHTPLERFREYLTYLKANHFRCLALRDVEPYVDWANLPADPMLNHRHPERSPDKLALPVEVGASRKEPRYWLENMLVHHRFTEEEAARVLGWSADEVRRQATEFGIGTGKNPNRGSPRLNESRNESPAQEPSRLLSRSLSSIPNGGEGGRRPGKEADQEKGALNRASSPPVRVLPYPGGREVRMGFLDGNRDWQRGTKASVFLPWDAASYVVVDLPEAIFSENRLIYLAHTHVPTIWDEQNVWLDNIDWTREPAGGLRFERVLPNQITFGAMIQPETNGAAMELWLKNGTEKPLMGLRTQICGHLKGAPEFNQQTTTNKLFRAPAVAVHSAGRDRWIITAWERCGRVWGQPLVPCLHADPVLPDCAPGETVRVRGRLWFYEGQQIESELARAVATFH